MSNPLYTVKWHLNTPDGQLRFGEQELLNHKQAHELFDVLIQRGTMVKVMILNLVGQPVRQWVDGEVA